MANVKVNQKEYKKLLTKIKKIENIDDKLGEQLYKTAKQTASKARRRWNPFIGKLKKPSITAKKGKKNKKPYAQVIAKHPSGNRFLAYTEWGTRYKFSLKNLKDIEYLMGKRPARSFANQFKAKRLVRPTNVPARPFLFNSAREELANLKKRLKRVVEKAKK